MMDFNFLIYSNDALFLNFSQYGRCSERNKCTEHGKRCNCMFSKVCLNILVHCDQDVLRTYRKKLDQVWCITSQTTNHGCELK